MIVSGYSMDLYCDGEHPEWNRPHETFAAETKAECLKQARDAGWIVGKDQQLCRARSGKKAKIRPLRPGERIISLFDAAQKESVFREMGGNQ